MVVAAKSFTYVSAQIKQLHLEAAEKFSDTEIADLVISGKEFKSGITGFTCVEFGSAHSFSTADEFVFNTSKQPVFNKNFDLLGQNLKANRQKGYRNILLTSSPKQMERLHACLLYTSP